MLVRILAPGLPFLRRDSVGDGRERNAESWFRMATAAPSFSPTELVPHKVNFAPGLLSEIANLVLEGHSATSHGGLEIGGVLFGRRECGRVYVEAFRPLSCDHSLGPRFMLSEGDENRLRDLLAAPAKDMALLGLEAVGWYCSHTRSELVLLDRECLLHKTYFARPDDFLIIFKPRGAREVDSAMFFPEIEGNDGQEPPIAKVESWPKEEAQADSKQSFPLNGLNGQSSASAWTKWKPFALAAGIGAIMCFVAWEFVDQTRANSVPPRTAPREVALSLRPEAEDLALSWKSNFNQAKRAQVEIFDGPVRKNLDITDVFQPSGVVLFPHTTGNVQAVLTIEGNDGTLVRSTGFTDASTSISDNQTVAPVSLVSEAPHPHTRNTRHKRHKRLQ